MDELTPTVPSALERPIPTGTLVSLDPDAKFYDRNLVTGGSPWRLLRLSDASRRILERWAGGGAVRVGEERLARTLVQQGLLHPRFGDALNIDDIDVVIPVRDDVASLRSLLGQLSGLHVTVVDDGSRNPTMIRELATRFEVELIRLDHNQGPGAARNLGTRSTQRPWIWFIDVDVSIDNSADVLKRLAAQLGDPLVGAAAPRLRGGEGSSIRDRFERSFSPLDMGPRSGLVLPGATVGYVPSACLLVRRSALGDGFDPTLRIGEDVDLVWRLHDEGWLVRYLADVVVIHRARGTWRQWWRQRLRYGESASELAARYGPRLAPVRTDAWTLIAWTSVLVKSPMLGARIVRIARNTLRRRIEKDSDDADRVASSIIRGGMMQAGGPLARAIVRTYGPLVLIAALHPRPRRRLLALFALGTAWRWRHHRVKIADVPLALADDLAYCAGVWRGAFKKRSLRSLTPHITRSSIGFRDVLGLRPKSG